MSLCVGKLTYASLVVLTGWYQPEFNILFHLQVSILTQMAAWATRFFVSPDQFITHLPHTPAVPLATLAHDSTVNKYNFIIPHVLTQIMLEEMKEMSQMKHNVGHDVPDLATLQVRAPPSTSAL